MYGAAMATCIWRNIVLIEHKPVLFDAIEFDPTIASVDLLYDLAFPLMDFLRYDRRLPQTASSTDISSTNCSDHLDALATLPLFMSLRAAIRAKVLLARLDHIATKRLFSRSVRQYFELARRLIPPSRPCIAVGGLSGNGKIGIGARPRSPHRAPAGRCPVAHRHPAQAAIQGTGKPTSCRKAAYRPEVTGIIYDTIVQRAVRILSQGHSVVADAMFARASERTGIGDAARRLGVRFVGFFLETDLATRQIRVARREADASDATPEIAKLQESYDVGAIDWIAIDASGTPEQTLKALPAPDHRSNPM